MVSGGKRLKLKIGSGRDCFAIERRVCFVSFKDFCRVEIAHA